MKGVGLVGQLEYSAFLSIASSSEWRHVASTVSALNFLIFGSFLALKKTTTLQAQHNGRFGSPKFLHFFQFSNDIIYIYILMI